MKLVFASDSFKGSLSSERIGQLLVEAARETLPDAECVARPIADGGDGMLDAIRRARPAQRITFPAHDGLMRPVEGEILVEGNAAFVEAASTCGLAMLEDDERDPLATSSFGVGESIRFSLDQGCGEVFVGLGGTCTNDGGMGCLRALGVKFLDAEGRELEGCGADLGRVARMEVGSAHPCVRPSGHVPAQQLQAATITILSDVENPLLGPNGATFVFGPQKGAGPNALEELESGMRRFSEAAGALYPGTDFDTPGFGAAGGLGMALAVFLDAHMCSGIEELLSLTDFDSALEGADLVVTGEGKLDAQSLQGKAIGGIVAHAQRKEVPVVAICGKVALEDADLRDLGLSKAIGISEGQELTYAMAHAEQNYLAAAKSLFKSLEFNSL